MPPPRFIIIAVDGGAASGKSSTSRGVAARLNLLHVDTGSHYRAVTHAALQVGIEPADDAELARFLQALELETDVDGREARIRLNGRRIDDSSLRSGDVNAQVSRFAALPSVRQAVKSYQRAQADVARSAGFNGLIMDGRDIGTVIFPDADLKIFLTADEATRTARRADEGLTDTIATRDKLDSSRPTAPLLAASDAVIIDNSCLSLEAVISQVVTLATQS